MSYLLLKIALIFVLPMMIFNLVARALGSTQPPNPALRGFTEGCEGKSQPCWYGIVLGETIFEDAKHIINMAGYEISSPYGIASLDLSIFEFSLGQSMCPLVLITSSNGFVSSIEVSYECNIDLQIGNLVAFSGLPPAVLSVIGIPPHYEVVYGGGPVQQFSCPSLFDKFWKFSIYPSSRTSKSNMPKYKPKWFTWRFVFVFSKIARVAISDHPRCIYLSTIDC